MPDIVWEHNLPYCIVFPFPAIFQISVVAVCRMCVCMCGEGLVDYSVLIEFVQCYGNLSVPSTFLEGGVPCV